MKQTAEGVILQVKVIPKASQNKVVGWENEVLKIRLAAVPEKGAANRELISFLSALLHIPQRDIILLKGETSREKKLLLADQKLEDLQIKLSR